MKKCFTMSMLAVALSGCASATSDYSGKIDREEFAPFHSNANFSVLSVQNVQFDNEVDSEFEGLNAFKVVDRLHCQTKKVACKCCVSYAIPYYISFENHKANLNKNGKVSLQKLADEMSKQKYLFDQYSLIITVHTDSRGNADYNHLLSEKRAETIRNSLSKELDVSSNRFIVQGRGKEEPIYNPDDTPQKRARNRRVEFKLIE